MQDVNILQRLVYKTFWLQVAQCKM